MIVDALGGRRGKGDGVGLIVVEGKEAEGSGEAAQQVRTGY